jgi:Alpha/beta hydrolase
LRGGYDVTLCMRGTELLARRAASNLAAVEMDLAAATDEGDAERVALLQALAGAGADILLYRPHLQHYALLFGDLEAARHVAVVVPGVGDGTTLRRDWIPGAQNLFEAATSTAVVLWKGYDNPADILAAAAGAVECGEDLMIAAGDLTAFVESLDLDPDQSLTVVAHSFGTIVTGAALADCGLQVTDVVVAGSPGMTVDELRQLHVQQAHFFSEQAPGDPIAELGVFGASPSSPTFGGTRMGTNAPGHPAVMAHSRYFEAGSEALENIVDVVTGNYAGIQRHRPAFPEIAGGLVAWALRLPAAPVRVVGRHYRGPGFRIMVNWCQLIDVGASETGNFVCEVLDEGERALLWFAHRIGALPHPHAHEDGTPARASATSPAAAGSDPTARPDVGAPERPDPHPGSRVDPGGRDG